MTFMTFLQNFMLCRDFSIFSFKFYKFQELYDKWKPWLYDRISDIFQCNFLEVCEGCVSCINLRFLQQPVKNGIVTKANQKNIYISKLFSCHIKVRAMIQIIAWTCIKQLLFPVKESSCETQLPSKFE